jgi:hypothetical protein
VRHYQLVNPLKSLWVLPLLAISLSLPAEDARMQAGRSERAFPSTSELVKHVRTTQQQVEAIRKNYIFTMEEDEQEPEKHAGLRTVHHNTYEVHYSGPWVVQTLLAQDGHALSTQERQKLESDKQWRRARLGLAKLQSDPDAQGSGGLRLSDFLAADQFINLRRTHHRGRQVLLMDFVPNPGFRPHRAAEKILKNLRGTIWIDEQDLYVMRLEAHLVDSVGFGGFLASLKKGAAVIFENQKVKDEIWLPSYTELHFDARELFSTKHINLVQRFSNYRKFQVESEIKPF